MKLSSPKWHWLMISSWPKASKTLLTWSELTLSSLNKSSTNLTKLKLSKDWSEFKIRKVA
jgi:hypothetical protein